jgi:hypothetical protein
LFIDRAHYIIPNILPAQEALLMNDVFLVVLYASRIPPHLAVSVNGKLFTLTVKGANVDGELSALLRLIRKRNIESLFIKLSVPAFFTFPELHKEIRKYTLAYPRVDVGIATCLSPIKDFCANVFDTDLKNVNFVFDLLPKLYEQKIISYCYQMNLGHLLKGNSFLLNKYTMNDIYEGIRSASAIKINAFE